MLLRDPYALNAICSSILKCLTELYENYKLPRVSFFIVGGGRRGGQEAR